MRRSVFARLYGNNPPVFYDYEEVATEILEFGTPSPTAPATRLRNRRQAFYDSDASVTSPKPNTKLIARRKQKELKIMKLLDTPKRKFNVEDLRNFARSEGGLITDDIRLRAWPILAEAISFTEELPYIDNDREIHTFIGTAMNELSIDELRRHPDWNQVEMDVHRTLARFPPGIPEEERTSLQSDLIPLIVRVLSENNRFRYYQGFHDICLTLILVLGYKTAFRVARILAHRTVFKKYLTKSLEETAMHDLQYMYVLLFKHNPRLEIYLREAELGTLFALSWPLTWFSHVLNDYHQVVTCFDLFLSSDALMSIYVTAALVNSRQDEIFATNKDMPSLHHLLSNIPASTNISTVLESAQKLFKKYPPSSLQSR